MTSALLYKRCGFGLRFLPSAGWNEAKFTHLHTATTMQMSPWCRITMHRVCNDAHVEDGHFY